MVIVVTIQYSGAGLLRNVLCGKATEANVTIVAAVVYRAICIGIVGHVEAISASMLCGIYAVYVMWRGVYAAYAMLRGNHRH